MSRLCDHLQNFYRKMRRRRPIATDMLDTRLDRSLTTFDLVMLSLGHMIGPGVYVISGLVIVQYAGASTVLSFLLTGMVAVLIALCYAQFSVNIPKAGTCFDYVHIFCGEFPAFLVGWDLLLEYILSVAAVGKLLASYLDVLSEEVISNAVRRTVGRQNHWFSEEFDLISPVLILFIFIVVALGAKNTAYVNNVMLVPNLLVIIIICLTCYSVGNAENLTYGQRGFFAHGVQGTFSAMGIVFFAYLGYAAIATAAEETREPSKSLPIALCASTGVAVLLYCVTSLAIALLVPHDQLHLKDLFTHAFDKHGLKWTKYMVAFGTTIGLTSSLLAQSYALPRGIYAMARYGLLFSPLACLHLKTKTPLVTILISVVVSAVIAMLFPVKALLELASIGALLAAVVMIICLIKVHYMPAGDCPFILEQNNSSTIEKSVEAGETEPILPRRNLQKLEDIGRLRYRVVFLRDWEAGRVVNVALVVLCLSLIALTCTLVIGVAALAAGLWWIVFLLATEVTVSVACLSVLLLYQHNTSFSEFKVPLFPFVPVLALFSALYMMMGLGRVTWIRLSVWMAAGLVFYIIFGIWKAVDTPHEEYLELDDLDEPSRRNQESLETAEVDPELPQYSEVVGVQDGQEMPRNTATVMSLEDQESELAPGGATGSTPYGATGSTPYGATGSTPGGATGSTPRGATGSTLRGASGSTPGVATGSTPRGASGSTPGGATGSTPRGASGSMPGGATGSTPRGARGSTLRGASGSTPGGATGSTPGGASGSTPAGATGLSRSGATGLFPGSATGSTPGGATGSTPGGATGSTPGGTTGSTPGGATGSTPGGATGSTPGGATGLSRSDATGSSRSGATGSALGGTTGSALGGATGSTPGVTTGLSQSGATGPAPDGATGSSLDAAIGSALGSATGSAPSGATGSAPDSATGSDV